MNCLLLIKLQKSGSKDGGRTFPLAGAHSFCAAALRFQYAKTSLHPISISQPPFVDTSCATQKKKREWHWQIDSISRAILSFLLLLSLVFCHCRARPEPALFSALSPLTPHFRFPHFYPISANTKHVYFVSGFKCVYIFSRAGKSFWKMHAASGKCMKNTHKAPFSMNKPIELLTRLSIGVGIFLILSCVNSRWKMCRLE